MSGGVEPHLYSREGGNPSQRAGEFSLRDEPPPSRGHKSGTRFAGYAAVFDRPDKSGDIVRKGAFSRAVAAGAKRLPLLWQHDSTKPIGVIESLSEDERGLRIIGRLDGTAHTAQEAASLLSDGAIDGLSFGYRVRSAVDGVPNGLGRQLTDLDLVEVSLVTFPMQPLARVHAVENSTTPNQNGDLNGL